MLYIKLINVLQPISLIIDWRAIQYFVLGIITGIILLILSIAFILSRSERIKTKNRLGQTVALDDKVVLDMVESKQDQLDKTVKLTDGGYFKVAVDLSLELSEEIARYYFPKSRFPIYELSIQEMLDLNFYITKRVEELMNGKFFKLFKNYRIATILDILNTRKKINNSKLMQITRKMKLQQIYSATRTVLNYANPIYWFRKLAIKPTTVVVTKEICKYIIAIFGEETNKIYSKAIFKEEDSESDILQKIDQFIEEKED
jgi:hypothetical protein